MGLDEYAGPREISQTRRLIDVDTTAKSSTGAEGARPTRVAQEQADRHRHFAASVRVSSGIFNVIGIQIWQN
jgi:hypothetical protein